MTGVRDAATVVVVRDAPDLHVFMLRRNPAMVFGGGAHVFPGGAVDAADRDVAEHVVGLDDHEASRRLGVGTGGLGFWVAAVREAYEEADILLIPGIPRDEALRRALNRRDADARHLFASAAQPVVLDDLLLFAHFVTPPGAPRRYDTWFFVADGPDDQLGAHDDDEAVDSEWVRPQDALERHDGGDIELFGPTAQVLSVLARYDSAEALVSAVRAAQGATGSRAGVAREGWGERIVLPGERGFGTAATTWTQPLIAPSSPRAFAPKSSAKGAA